MIISNDITRVRENIEEFVGQPVVIKCNKGKRRTTVSKGILESTYPSVFVVKFNNDLDNTFHKTSFSYTDLLTKRIEFLVVKDPKAND